MLKRTVVIPLALLLMLAGCVPQSVVAPTGSPSPSAATPTPTPTETEAPAAQVLNMPGSCSDLVSLTTIHAQFAASFELITLTPGWGGPVAEDFAARGVLVCLWGIPQSDAGAVSVYVAERATGTDEQQVDAWRAAGYTECPPFLDACYFEAAVSEEVGAYRIVHVLVGGFEIRTEAVLSSIDPLLVVVREAATNMGYV